MSELREKVDFFDNGRFVYNIKGLGNRVSGNLRSIRHMERNGECDFSDLEESHRKYDIEVIDRRRFDGDYDCRSWAFDKIGLPSYVDENTNRDLISLVFECDLGDLAWTGNPKEGSMVFYLNLGKSVSVTHFGVIEKPDIDMRIVSKWGKGYVYSHPVGNVPDIYGKNVMFFDKR